MVVYICDPNQHLGDRGRRLACPGPLWTAQQILGQPDYVSYVSISGCGETPYQGNLYKKDLFGLWLHRVVIYNGRAIMSVGRRHGRWNWKLSAHNLSPKHKTESELGMMYGNSTSSNKATLPKPHQIAPPTRGQASIWTNGILLTQTTALIFRVNCLEISEAPT